MITYPTSGNGVNWTPVAGGAGAETSYDFTAQTSGTAVNTLATIPVRLHTSNEVTKAGISRSVIKVEAFLDAALTTECGAPSQSPKSGAYAKNLTPVTMHCVFTAPRSAAQLANNERHVGLKALLEFMLANMLTIVTGRSSDENVQTGASWDVTQALSALRGLQLFDPVSGSYGKATANV